MAEEQAEPATVVSIRISKVECNVQAGPSRCIARLAQANTLSKGIKAIWRNEIGRADCTPPRAQA